MRLNQLNRSEQEYLALDITSISSWSKLIDDVEWGYNRDDDKLPQINLSLLLGLESRLPVRMTTYNGSIKVVEKGFMKFKNSLGLNRLRVHSQKRMEGKMLVGFIALILSSHVHNIMFKNDLYKTMTMRDLIKNMERIKTQVIGDKRILFPLTKKQKDIFEMFEIEKPR